MNTLANVYKRIQTRNYLSKKVLKYTLFHRNQAEKERIRYLLHTPGVSTLSVNRCYAQRDLCLSYAKKEYTP